MSEQFDRRRFVRAQPGGDESPAGRARLRGVMQPGYGAEGPGNGVRNPPQMGEQVVATSVETLAQGAGTQ